MKQGVAPCAFKPASVSLGASKGSFASGSAKLQATPRRAPLRGNPLLKVEARKTAGAQIQVRSVNVLLNIPVDREECCAAIGWLAMAAP